MRLLEDAPGHYRLQAEQFAGVAAIDVTIAYDSGTLQLENVSQGPFLTGTLFAGNANQAGRVRIGVASAQALNGSGILANLGGRLLKSPAVILSVSAKLSDSAGKPLPVRTEYPVAVALNNRNPAETQPAAEQAASSSTSSGLGSSSVTVGGIDAEQAAEATATEALPRAKPPYEEQTRENPQESPREALPSAPYVEKQKNTFTAVLQRFEDYTGERSLAKLRPLFQRAADAPSTAPRQK